MVAVRKSHVEKATVIAGDKIQIFGCTISEKLIFFTTEEKYEIYFMNKKFCDDFQDAIQLLSIQSAWEGMICMYYFSSKGKEAMIYVHIRFKCDLSSSVIHTQLWAA